MTDYLRIVLGARLSAMEERGASTAEYGLLIAGIATLIVAVVLLFGRNISDVLSSCPTAGDGPGDSTCS